MVSCGSHAVVSVARLQTIPPRQFRLTERYAEAARKAAAAFPEKVSSSTQPQHPKVACC